MDCPVLRDKEIQLGNFMIREASNSLSISLVIYKGSELHKGRRE